MRFSRATAALLALPTATLAVSLSDFTPRVSNLPSSCSAVYTSSISGCQGSDFQSSCSKTCVQALNTLTLLVQKACGNEGLTGSNIIVAFLNGDGPSALCDDADEILGGGSSSSSASQAATSSTSSSSTTSAASSTSSAASTSNSATSASLTRTETVTAVSSSATGSSSAILVATSSPSSTGTSTGHSSQTNMADSGGGSPFDAAYTGGAATSALSMATTIFTTLLALSFALR